MKEDPALIMKPNTLTLLHKDHNRCSQILIWWLCAVTCTTQCELQQYFRRAKEKTEKGLLPNFSSRHHWKPQLHRSWWHKPFVTACKRGSLLFRGHRFFEPIAAVLSVAVAVAALLRQWELSIAFSSGFLPQFVPVVLDVRLLLQPAVVCLQLENI